MDILHQLQLLAKSYEQQTISAYRAAEKEDDAFGKRFIEYGAIIKGNHVQDLRALLNGKSLF